jgi:hypothetical protein
MEPERTPQAKKTYQAPALAKYGTLTQMTAQTGSMKSSMDGGANNTKTA